MIPFLLLAGFSLWMLRTYFRKNAYYFFCILLPYVMFVWKALSLIYLETGVYATELGRTTSRVYSDYIFLAEMLVFWLVLTGSIRFLKGKIPDPAQVSQTIMRSKIYYWIRILHCAVVGYLYLNLALSGTAFSGAFDRFSYFSASKLPFISMFSGALSYLFLFIDGLLYFYRKKNKGLSIVLLILTLLYQVLIGNKFSGLYQNLVFFFSPYFIIKASQAKQLQFKAVFTRKFWVLVAFGFVVLLWILYLSYAEQIKAGKSFWELLLNRLLNLQAGTVWGITNYMNAGPDALLGNSDQLSMEIRGILQSYSEMDTRVGLPKVMQLVSQPYIVESYLSAGVRFSGWYLTVTYLCMGYVGSMIYSVFLAILFALICAVFVTSVKRTNIIMMGLSLYEYIQFYDYFRIGNFTILLNFSSVALLVVQGLYLMAIIKRRRVVFGKLGRKKRSGERER